MHAVPNPRPPNRIVGGPLIAPPVLSFGVLRCEAIEANWVAVACRPRSGGCEGRKATSLIGHDCCQRFDPFWLVNADSLVGRNWSCNLSGERSQGRDGLKCTAIRLCIQTTVEIRLQKRCTNCLAQVGRRTHLSAWTRRNPCRSSTEAR